MSRNKAVIGDENISEEVARADLAIRRAAEASNELTMIRHRIGTFFSAVTQVSFPASPPSWAEDWPEWLETGEVTNVLPEQESIVEETPAP